MTLISALVAFGPSLRGPFVFDDRNLPFWQEHLTGASLLTWISGVRPLLMLSFWVNFQLSGQTPFSYHVLNVLLHGLNVILVFLVVRRLLRMRFPPVDAKDNTTEVRVFWSSALVAAIFLLHPLQTESVAYIASRSEVLSAVFFLAAFLLFVSTESMGWGRAAVLVCLYGAAVSTKEHTVALPAALLLTDVFWRTGAPLANLRRSWRLYALLGAAGAVGVALILRILTTATTAGFRVAGIAWYEYFFTECRVIWRYIQLFLFPYGQRLDYDIPISRSILDHGALFGLLGLAALIAAAIVLRRRYPAASYGVLLFLLLIAPTSSLIPIADPIAEHRMYLPLVGLAFACAQPLLVVREPLRLRAPIAVALAVLALLTFTRSRLFADEVELWRDVAAKSPDKSRAQMQLITAYLRQNRCTEAVAWIESMQSKVSDSPEVLLARGQAHQCLKQEEKGLVFLRRAAEKEPSAVAYTLIGLSEMRLGRHQESMAAFDAALGFGDSDSVYALRGDLYAQAGDIEAAVRDYRFAVNLNPYNAVARTRLAAYEEKLRARERERRF